MGMVTRMSVCVRVCFPIHREDVKDGASNRCKPWTSGWHISNTKTELRGGADLQQAPARASLTSRGIVGEDWGCTNYSIHLFLLYLLS